MIKFDNVSKKFSDGTIAVNSLHIDIKDGEFFVFIGPSGSGKTTTLKMINQLISPSEGDIFINGKKNNEDDIYQLRWNIGYVLQEIALFPHMTIEENISVVPELKKWSKAKMRHRAYELLDMVGLHPEEYAHRKPSQLSGGEQQRVGVIRALATDPDIILMDEPFSALDPISRENLQDDLLKLISSLQKTTVFVTHDMQEALKLADRICLMKDGQIVQVGTPYELIHHPKNEFVRQFVGGHGPSWNEQFSLDNILLPIEQIETSHLTTVSASTSLHEVLEKLSHEERVLVEKENHVIGYVDRQVVIEYISDRLPERGGAHE